LKNDELSEMFRIIIQPTVEHGFKQPNEKVDTLEETVKVQQHRIQSLEHKIDQIEQDGKANQAIISGIAVDTDQDKNIQNLVDFFDVVMQIKLEPSDITSAHGLRNTKDPQPMLVTVPNTNARSKIFNKKKGLKDHVKRVYINENLTKQRAAPFKKARELVKDKKAHSAWVYKGNIMIRHTEKEPPEKIFHEDYLQKYLKITIPVDNTTDSTKD
jgi:hypothetical protein